MSGHRPRYDPGWVYHRLLIGPLADAALLLDRLLSGNLLPHGLLEDMQAALVLVVRCRRPWLTPGYGPGLMRGGVAGGLTLSGHNGVGPGSVVAVYRCTHGEAAVTCAVFHEGPDEALVEAELVQRITSGLILLRRSGFSREGVGTFAKSVSSEIPPPG